MGKYVIEVERPESLWDPKKVPPQTARNKKEQQEIEDFIKKVRGIIDDLNDQKAVYESDFQKSQDASKMLGVIYGLGDDINTASKALTETAEIIKSLGTKDRITGINEMFGNFEKTISSYAKNLTETNNKFLTEKVDKVGNIYTTILDEIGDEISKLQTLISACKNELSFYGKGE